MAGVRVYGRRENGCLHVPYFRGYGESEQDDLHDRHYQQNQHRAAVAQDVAELFIDERQKLFHGVILPV